MIRLPINLVALFPLLMLCTAAAPPGEAETRKALDRVVPEAAFDGTTLHETLLFLRDFTGATVWLDRERLKPEGVLPETPVRFRGNGLTAAQVLDGVVKSIGTDGRVAARPVGRVIIVSTPEGLAAAATRLEGLDTLMRDPAAKKVLGQELAELQFNDETLAEVVDWLRDVSNAHLFVDWKRLETEAGLKPNAVINVQAGRLPLGEALMLILHAAGGKTPLDLAVKDGVITIAPANPAA